MKKVVCAKKAILRHSFILLQVEIQIYKKNILKIERKKRKYLLIADISIYKVTHREFDKQDNKIFPKRSKIVCIVHILFLFL